MVFEKKMKLSQRRGRGRPKSDGSAEESQLWKVEILRLQGFEASSSRGWHFIEGHEYYGIVLQ